MKINHNVVDIWAYYKEGATARYLICKTSLEKAKNFNGSQFWQIPTVHLQEEQLPENGIPNRLAEFGLRAGDIWQVEHTYTIYNRRFKRIEIISVFAVEIFNPEALKWDEKEYETGTWGTYSECQEKLVYRGLREGLKWAKDYITEVDSPRLEFRL